MQADGVFAHVVMVVRPLDTPRIVDATAAMEAWCHMKAAASPNSRIYRFVGDEIRKSLTASRILICRYGHRHPPEKVWVNFDNPNRPRPYHCAECTERRKQGRTNHKWIAFDSPST